LTLLAAAKYLLPHTDSTEPVHPPPLTSDPALAPYYHSLLHTPGLEPSYSPHCVLIPVSLNPSPPGGELTQPTPPCTSATSIPVFNKHIINFPVSPDHFLQIQRHKVIFKMWALLVLTFALATGASERTNNTASEERPVIARGKLMAPSVVG
ncbi:hypothetical protein AMECASPLE_022743, partial [Ameca splendens]